MPFLHITNFSATPTSGTVPLTVNFTDLSSGPPTAWSWDFGDPASGVLNTSTLQNPSHTYSSAGTYTVALTPTAPAVYVTQTQTNLITVSAPPNTVYTLTSADAGKETRVTNASPGTDIHIPTNAAHPDILVGMVFIITKISSGTVTLINDGVTLNTSLSPLVIPAVGNTVRLVKVATDEWDMQFWS